MTESIFLKVMLIILSAVCIAAIVIWFMFKGAETIPSENAKFLFKVVKLNAS